jgi:hypothetical protein
MVQSTDPGRRSTKRRGSKLSVRAGLDRGDQHHQQQKAQADWQPPDEDASPDVQDGYLRGPLVGSGG